MDLYEVVDPRPIAAEAKYTFFLPAPERVALIGAGDLVKVTMSAIPPSEKWDAERVWIAVKSTNPDWVEGTLESEPYDMPLLAVGAVIRVPRTHIIDVLFGDPDKEAALSPPRREYWERCLVEQVVLDGLLPVHYLYRETPEASVEGDAFPDSGWRIRGDQRGVPDNELEQRKVARIALGAVLNRDDSWLHLIDARIGSAFIKDMDRGIFVPAS